MTTTPAVAAVLFDMDGTLVDTERLWWEAAATVADSIGRPLTAADEPAVTGRPVAYTAEYLQATSDATLPVESLAEALEDAFARRVRDQLAPRPGALELLESLAALEVPTAIVSASPRRIVDMVATTLGEHLFTATVAVEDTPHTKPEPDPYELAASILGVAPEDCVVVEDTEIGAQAAIAAGCAVLAVPSEGQRIDRATRRTVRESLVGLTPHDLAALT